MMEVSDMRVTATVLCGSMSTRSVCLNLLLKIPLIFSFSSSRLHLIADPIDPSIHLHLQSIHSLYTVPITIT
jgi:hypothetical protein